MSGDGGDDRASMWLTSQREARRRIEANPQAAAAVQKLLRAGIRESDLWLVLSGALHMKRTLADVVEHEQLQHERDQVAKASKALAVLAEFIDEVFADWPSLFSLELKEVAVDRIIDAFGDIGQIVQTRAFLAKHHRAILGAARYAGQADDPDGRQAAARRFAIGEIAYWVLQLDPKHAAHSGEVVKISKALLGGQVIAKEVVAYRDTRGKLERDWDENDLPKLGLTLADLRSRPPTAENGG